MYPTLTKTYFVIPAKAGIHYFGVPGGPRALAENRIKGFFNYRFLQ
jgi:hypothetical protein